MKRFIKTFLAASLAIAGFASCNTTIGLGRDMRVLGEQMEQKAGQQQGGATGGDDYYGGAPVY